MANSPQTPNIWSFVTARSTKSWFACISLFAVLIRLAVALHPYSGAATPPTFGDFEAQRHWMEITVNLPVKDWYRNSTLNDFLVWDVLLFEGNRVMLFRTALALMDLYGPALVTTKDAGDAVKLLQSLADSTFDSSLLVLTACMGFQNIQETNLQELRNKHRPAVRVALDETLKADRVWKDSQGPGWDCLHSDSTINEEVLYLNINANVEMNSDKDIEEQLGLLKAEICKQLKEKRSAELRAEELHTALMEMVEHDNRRQLSARVEQLEREVTELQRALDEKKMQEKALVELLVRVEQEQKVTEDARKYAEQDAAAQGYAVQVIQEKYEEAGIALAEMERRAVMAESMLEATLQSQLGNYDQMVSPQSSQVIPNRMLSSIFRWRDRNKLKAAREGR